MAFLTLIVFLLLTWIRTAPPVYIPTSASNFLLMLGRDKIIFQPTVTIPTTKLIPSNTESNALAPRRIQKFANTSLLTVPGAKAFAPDRAIVAPRYKSVSCFVKDHELSSCLVLEEKSRREVSYLSKRLEQAEETIVQQAQALADWNAFSTSQARLIALQDAFIAAQATSRLSLLLSIALANILFHNSLSFLDRRLLAYLLSIFTWGSGSHSSSDAAATVAAAGGNSGVVSLSSGSSGNPRVRRRKSSSPSYMRVKAAEHLVAQALGDQAAASRILLQCLEGALGEADRGRGELGDRVLSLESLLKEGEKRGEGLRRQVQSLAGEYEGVETQLQACKVTVSSLEAELAAVGRDKEQLTVDLLQCAWEREIAVRKGEEAHVRWGQAEREKAVLALVLMGMKGQLQRMEARAEEAEEEAQTLMERGGKLLVSTKLGLGLIDVLKAAMTKLREENTKLRGKVEGRERDKEGRAHMKTLEEPERQVEGGSVKGVEVEGGDKEGEEAEGSCEEEWKKTRRGKRSGKRVKERIVRAMERQDELHERFILPDGGKQGPLTSQ